MKRKILKTDIVEFSSGWHLTEEFPAGWEDWTQYEMEVFVANHVLEDNEHHSLSHVITEIESLADVLELFLEQHKVKVLGNYGN